MSYLGFSDTGSGINIIFYDVQSTSSPANFVMTDLGTHAYGVHTVKLSLDAIDGPSNDVVKVWIDGILVHTGTSWEDYYRYDVEASAEQSPRIIKTMLFRAGGTAHPANAGKGYLIDNLSLLSGPMPLVQVTIDKLIDGKMATTGMANSNSFPMTATWSATNIGSGSGSYALGPVGFNSPNPYEAVTAGMTSGASYTTSENTSGSTVGASCADGKPYALVGYTSGSSFAAAQSAVPTTTAPQLSNIVSSQWILVWNKPCLPAPVNVSPADGAVLTSAAFDKADWTDVPNDGFPPITYLYESSNASTTNLDGSFTSPAYVSGTLAVSEIPTPGTPAGTWYWHARAVDADGNMSPWSAATKVIIDNAVPTTTLKVHVLKYLDGVKATASSSSNYQFPMTATWQTANLNGGATTSGAYVLGNFHGGAADQYGADTSSMQAAANYSTAEITNDIDNSSQVLPTSAQCASGKYRLLGYKTSSTSFADAAAQSMTSSASFFNLSSDKWMITYNETCPTGPVPPPANACATPGVAPQGWTLRTGSSNSETVILTPFTMFVGNGGNDKVVAPDGNYIICTGSGNDVIKVGNGNSVIDAGNGNNVVKTGNGDQQVTTGSGNDVIATGSGNDTINAGNGNNAITAGSGNDSITTGSGNDAMVGGPGTDTCSAGAGHNAKASCEL